ncbi:MAG: ATP synthase F1 subunit epsilon [Buchnera aphidicola (Periphyllus acericola)]|uniref:ATP synthase F1 subunit epsilon n=1 Tax=Buchnera aphidicola TaxID=9 RepID=UPI0030D249DF|nr:ATP synthase F1 subunit epsilon [Buchnera aphidicola (Periphyllus acericola)]
MCFFLNIVSLKKKIFSKKVKSVKFPGIYGDLSIFLNHAPLLTFIKSGSIDIKLRNGNLEYIYISKGILEVQPKITNVLANYAINSKNLNNTDLINKKNKIKLCYKTNKDFDYNYQIKKKYNNILKKIFFLKNIRKKKKKK